MSDLANSCEYFTAEETCNLVAESAKAKANREVRCGNPEKLSCCYLCQLRPQCAISCKYLGSSDTAYVLVELEKAPTESRTGGPKEPQETEISNNQAKYCPDCNAEMSEAKTELRVDNWKGPKPTFLSADMLPIVVYLCQQCGKIELKTYRQQSRD